MALAVCLLLDDRSESAVRALWRRIEVAGVPSMLTHTHGHHVPHLTFASLLAYDLDAVRAALAALPVAPPLPLYFDGLGSFRRGRCWLAPAASAGLVVRQSAVVSALGPTGAVLHRNYRSGVWTPHLTLAPRAHLDDLRSVAALVYDVLPVRATATRAALIDTSTGEHHPLEHLV
jgi:2'-5' RNA ligase